MYERISGRREGVAQSLPDITEYIYSKTVNRHGMTCLYHVLIGIRGDERRMKPNETLEFASF